MAPSQNLGTPADVLADLQAAARYAVTGQGDPETLRRIEERAERSRQELEAKLGTQTIAASLVREARDAQ